MVKTHNILFVTPGFALDESDTTCIPALQEFILGLRNQTPHIRITIITLHYPELKKEYSWNGCKVYALGAANCKFPKRYYYWENLKNLIRKLHEQKPFDLIHSFWYDEVTYVVNKINSNLKLPIYSTFMGQEAVNLNRYSKRINIPNSNLIALSNFQLSDIVERIKVNPTHLVPWASTIRPQHSAKDIDLINIGWFNDVKNQNEAIDILATIKEVHPNIKMVFVGEGTLLKQCISRVEELRLSENIDFLGLMPRNQVVDMLGRSKVLLHSSKYESFGMIFPEAISAQTMVVSRRVGIASEEKWWKIYESKDEAVNGILQFLASPVYPTTVDQKKYSMQNTVEAYLKIWGIKKDRP